MDSLIDLVRACSELPVSPLMGTLATSVVELAALYFVALGAFGLVNPMQTSRFLASFAESANAHYLELAIRFVVGGAFLLHSPESISPVVFAGFGWVLVTTTAALLMIPWQWHRRFAQWSVPHAVRHLKLVAFASLTSGGLLLAAVLRETT